MTTTRKIIHHRGYSGDDFRTAEDELENARLGLLASTFTLSGDISPTALSGDVDNYNPTGLSTSAVIRIDGGASDRNITGLVAQGDGSVKIILNVGTTNSLILKNDTTSTAANRFLFGADIAIRQGGGLVIWYDTTSSRWRPAIPRIATTTGLLGGNNLGEIRLDINALTEDASPDQAADFLLSYDTSASAHKKVKPQNLGGMLGAFTALSSTATTITGISAAARMVVLNIVGMSWNGTVAVRFRIGPSGGVATSGYLGAQSFIVNDTSLASINYTAGFDCSSDGAAGAGVYHGQVTFTLADAATNTWIAQGTLGRSDAGATYLISGSVPLSGVLERIAITTVAGTATADAGSISVLVYT